MVKCHVIPDIIYYARSLTYKSFSLPLIVGNFQYVNCYVANIKFPAAVQFLFAQRQKRSWE